MMKNSGRRLIVVVTFIAMIIGAIGVATVVANSGFGS
jgi:hypothetical protein